jgi:hypothetical protein
VAVAILFALTHAADTQELGSGVRDCSRTMVVRQRWHRGGFVMMNRMIRSALVLCVATALGAAASESALAAPSSRAPAKRATAAPTSATRPTSRPGVSANLPTQEAIKAAFDAGEYQRVLQFVGRAIAAKPGTTPSDYDRYELLTMRGESYLRLKQNKSATDAFAQAAKETKDEQKAAIARATQRTIRESRGSTVQRRAKSPASTGTPTTANLLKPDEREAAFRIVYDNLRESATPKIKAAAEARTLPPIIDALTAVADLDDLAQAGAGGDSDLAAARQELGERGRELITRELDRMDKDVAEIRRSAETVVEQRSVAVTSMATGSGYDKYLSIRRGLTDKDRADLKEVLKTCERIIPAAEQLARSTSGTAKNADETVNRAIEVGRAAQRVLEAKYELTQQAASQQRQVPQQRQVQQPQPQPIRR